MSARTLLRRRIGTVAASTLALSLTLAGLVAGGLPSASAATASTAWQNGRFQVDTAGVVSRSDIILGVPNPAPAQSLGLGNGALGVAAWAAGGFTAQLNRTDTMPDRKSPGQLQIPGLSAMTSAADFTGRLDLYNGVLTESGGGLTMKAWVPAGKDELIVDVTGANPAVTQTANVHLWSGRNPAAAASGGIGTLAETWVDNNQQQPSGRTFGSLAAITAGGQSVTASVVNSTTVQVSFRPNANGSFRIVVGAPSWTGGNPATTASNLIGADATTASATLLAGHSAWWNTFWANTGLIRMSSADGSADYMEALRTIYLYTAAASMRGAYPGSQAGVANLFSFGQDHQNWTPSSFWLWNLRSQLAANMSSGNTALNTTIFDLYLNNIAAIQTWTRAQMGGRAGICVPEVMRFNGNGGDPGPGANAACSQPGSPNWNALNVTSGAEISMFVWQQYQLTGDVAFLRRYYPLLQQSAIFLLAYHTRGTDGLLHSTANAHETQWAVKDPTTNLVAMQALFPATIAAAQLLGTDTALVSQLQTAIGQIPPYARTDQATQKQLLTPASDASGTNVIAASYEPAATIRNSENIGLEPVWPWNVISDTSSMLALARRTYAHRPVTGGNDWSLDAVQAARLGLPADVRSRLIGITQAHQVYISGMADLGNTVGQQSYVEQAATVATAVNEALVQDYDGLLRIAPAWPADWDVSGTVSIHRGGRVDVQVFNGTPATVAVHAGATETLRIRNPWAGQQVEVVNGTSGALVLAGTTAGTLDVPVTAGQAYLVQRTSARTTSLPFAQVTGTRATTAKHLGNVKIGLDGTGGTPGTVISLRSRANGQYVTADNAGASPLIANRTAIGPWESFDRINNADGSISLRAHANGKLVAADNAGAAPLLAKNTAIGSWESFDLVNNADGSVSLRARVNGMFVCAENAGAAALIANRAAIGLWESFDLVID